MKEPDFIPYEELWKNFHMQATGKWILSNLIPNRLTCIFKSSYILGIDYTWIDAILHVVGPMDYGRTRDRANLFTKRVADSELPHEMQVLLNEPMNSKTIAKADQIILNLDEKRRCRAYPTFVEEARHIFGVQRAFYPQNDSLLKFEAACEIQ